MTSVNSIIKNIVGKLASFFPIMHRLKRRLTALRQSNVSVSSSEQIIPIGDVRCVDNFYELESDGVTSWRWTGPGKSFSCFVSVERQLPWCLALEVIDTPSTVNWDNTFISVEGTMALCRYDYRNGRHLFISHLPARPGASGVLLNYVVQDVRLPGIESDKRPLGLRVVQFRLTPV